MAPYSASYLAALPAPFHSVPALYPTPLQHTPAACTAPHTCSLLLMSSMGYVTSVAPSLASAVSRNTSPVDTEARRLGEGRWWGGGGCQDS